MSFSLPRTTRASGHYKPISIVLHRRDQLDQKREAVFPIRSHVISPHFYISVKRLSACI